MSWSCIPYTCFRELEEESSETSCLDTYQLELLKSKNTPERFCCRDNLTGFFRYFRFGMILKRSGKTTPIPLTISSNYEELETDLSFVGDSHVKILVPQVKDEGFLEVDRDCGLRWRESLAKYDPKRFGWKTRHCSLLEDSEKFLEIFPKWGIMQDGVLWERRMPEHLIEEKGFGCWPTPEHKNSDGYQISGNKKYFRLGAVVKNRFRSEGSIFERLEYFFKNHDLQKSFWATPSSRDWKDTPGMAVLAKNRDGSVRKRTDMLARQVYSGKNSFPTPTAQDFKKRGPNSRQQSLSNISSQKLNPDWVELLMGWPKNFTAITPMDLEYFSRWLTGFISKLQDNGRDFEKSKECADIGVLLAGIEATELVLQELWSAYKNLGLDWDLDRYGIKNISDFFKAVSEVYPLQGKAAWRSGAWEASVSRCTSIIKNRVNRLKAIGNGQVPQALVLAWNLLHKLR